jgi:hypothetical protein
MEEKAGGISPPIPIHVVLTPSEREALQAILNAQRNPRVFNPWYSDATITFDHYPFNFTPIQPGVDLAASQPYAFGYGVQFTGIPAPPPPTPPKPVYAVAGTNFSGQSGNVVSLNDYDPNDPTKYSTFDGGDGAIVATFTVPVNWVTIDVWPYSPWAGAPSTNVPYLQALDANMNILTTELASPVTPNAWQTFTPISRPQADIWAVAFSLLGTATEPVGVVFDNLHFKRPA